MQGISEFMYFSYEILPSKTSIKNRDSHHCIVSGFLLMNARATALCICLFLKFVLLQERKNIDYRLSSMQEI